MINPEDIKAQLAKAKREEQFKQDQLGVCVAIWLLGGGALTALTDTGIESFGISLVIGVIYAYGLYKGR